MRAPRRAHEGDPGSVFPYFLTASPVRREESSEDCLRRSRRKPRGSAALQAEVRRDRTGVNPPPVDVAHAAQHGLYRGRDRRFARYCMVPQAEGHMSVQD